MGGQGESRDRVVWEAGVGMTEVTRPMCCSAVYEHSVGLQMVYPDWQQGRAYFAKCLICITFENKVRGVELWEVGERESSTLNLGP